MAEAGRYHLFASYACPWCSRAILVRSLKGLEDAVGMTNLDPQRDALGWRFSPQDPDPVLGATHLVELYRAGDPAFDGPATAPMLWDLEQRRVASTDSGELMRMFNSEFNTVALHPQVDLYPEDLRDEIDTINRRVQRSINSGVYAAGTATIQPEYEQHVRDVFAALDWLEQLLAERRFVAGERLTEADLRLAASVFRFDAVYAGLFKCSIRRLVDHPNLWAWARSVYQSPGVAETVRFDEIKRHYYGDRTLNPNGVIPVGPEIDWL